MHGSDRQFSPYELNQLAKYGVPLTPELLSSQIPVEYITGHVEFSGLDIHVTPNVLIPRLETEELVALTWQQTAHKLAAMHRPLQLLEVGTGSGAIALSLYHLAQQAAAPLMITAVDVSAAALATAHTNANRLFPDHALSFLESDLLTAFANPLMADVIVANLPYIPSSRLPELDAGVVEFEPLLALDGGPDGLSLIKSLLSQVESKSEVAVTVLLEIDHTHRLEQLLAGHSPNWRGQIVPDQFGQPRFALLELDPNAPQFV